MHILYIYAWRMIMIDWLGQPNNCLRDRGSRPYQAWPEDITSSMYTMRIFKIYCHNVRIIKSSLATIPDHSCHHHGASAYSHDSLQLNESAMALSPTLISIRTALKYIIVPWTALQPRAIASNYNDCPTRTCAGTGLDMIISIQYVWALHETA